MKSSSKPIILSSDVVKKLPAYYRALAELAAKTGRAIIRESSQNRGALT